MPSPAALCSLKVATPDGKPLIDDLTIGFGPKRYGLVGRNGCRKSTIAYSEEPTCKF